MTTPTGPGSDEFAKRQRARSIAIAVALGAFALIFYGATIVRLGPNALKRDDFGVRTDAPAPSTATPAQPGASSPSDADCKKAGTC